jgi:hypothetical protein
MFALVLEAVRGRPRSSKQGPLTPLPGIDTQISALFTPPSTPINNIYLCVCVYIHIVLPTDHACTVGERWRKTEGGKAILEYSGKFLNSDITQQLAVDIGCVLSACSRNIGSEIMFSQD